MQEKLSKQEFLARARQQNKKTAKELQIAAFHHIDSFNYIRDYGLEKIKNYIQPLEIYNTAQSKIPLPFKEKFRVWIEKLNIINPRHQDTSNKLYPSYCRIAKQTYSGQLHAVFMRQVDNKAPERFNVDLGSIPIMVLSNVCNLNGLSEQKRIEQQEDQNEFGGYFIINGNEKVIRMLVNQKRNYPIVFERNGYIGRGPGFTQYVCQMKCVREDLFSKTISLHYISDGNITLRILYKKQEFLIPLIILLKALTGFELDTIYEKFRRGSNKNNLIDRIQVLVYSLNEFSLSTQNDCLEYIGRNFKLVLGIQNPNISDSEIGQIFLQRLICVHTKNFEDKFNTLINMSHKLYALVNKETRSDNLDSCMNQEVLLSGHLYLMFLQEKLDEMFQALKQKMFKDFSRSSSGKNQGTEKMITEEYITKNVTKLQPIGKKIEYLLATGNLKSQTGLDLMQNKGFSIIADKLNNMRFLSHFRAIHRGAYFAEMKTTAVRKLLPEQWGFVCPVHTPDGGPCGLLNHISSSCVPLTRKQPFNYLEFLRILSTYGLLNLDVNYDFDSVLTVQIDGKVVGYVENERAKQFSDSIRTLKITNHVHVPRNLEIALIQRTGLKVDPVYPGIYMFTEEGRFQRQVKNLKHNRNEWIGPLEQVFMSIACYEDDIREDTEYQDLSQESILSILSNMIPFVAYNQSPRNMYQNQMAKQTLGTPMQNHQYRFDNKTYRIISPQIPLVKPSQYDNYQFGDYASGTNTVVAVISYTGYDMEDACIINKSSWERGFAHAVIYKNYSFQLNDEEQVKMGRNNLMTHQTSQEVKNNLPPNLQVDGIPPIGTPIKKGMTMFSLFDTNTEVLKKFKHKDGEMGYLDNVAIVQTKNGPEFQYKLRIPRNPVIGDKFASRHAQKGVLSILWPQEDMPFTESGICPDFIINPHAFPSRMTIGMLIESLAAKQGAVEGKIQETTPFENFEDDDIVKYFGEQLKSKGYSYYGNETMYSGVYGNEMKVEIFQGIVYYQRLRHMVSDKSQARNTGPVDVLTQQPVKGRKKGGGIRMGEMERDALLAHGISFCLHDRFLYSSDYSEGYICNSCGSMLSSYQKNQLIDINQQIENRQSSVFCRACNKENQCSKIIQPYVLRYLTNELAAMNIKVKYTLK